MGVQTARLLYNFPILDVCKHKNATCANPSASGYGPPPQWPFFLIAAKARH